MLEDNKENLVDLHSENPPVSKLTYWREEANLDSAILMVV